MTRASKQEADRTAWGRLRQAYCSDSMAWAGAVLVIALLALDVGLDLQIRRAHDPLGGRFFPVLISSLLAAAAAAILLNPLLRLLFFGDLDRPTRESAPATGGGLLDNPDLRVASMILICVLYVASLGVIGFLPSTALALSATLYVLGTRGLNGLLVAPVLATIAIYGVFTYALLVRLP